MTPRPARPTRSDLIAARVAILRQQDRWAAAPGPAAAAVTERLHAAYDELAARAPRWARIGVLGAAVRTHRRSTRES